MLYLDMPDWEQWATKALAKMRDKGCIVVRGIHLNARMLKAWQRLTKQEVVRVSFDLYDYGVACFHQDLHKQDYIICFQPAIAKNPNQRQAMPVFTLKQF